MTQSFYQQRKQDFAQSLASATKQINFISNLRLVAAAFFILFCYLAMKEPVLFYALPLLLFGFVLLMLKHSRLFKAKTHLENLVKINTNELQSLSGDFSCYANGLQFIDPHHPYSHDLDIFGNGSLFQYVNRCSTLNGTMQLAETFSGPLPSSDRILARQRAVKELKDKVDFRQNFLATGMELEEFKHDKEQLLSWAKKESFLFGKTFYVFTLWAFPILTLSVVLCAFLFDGFTSFAVVCAVLQWVFLGFHIKKVNEFHQYISRKKNILDKYARLLHLFSNETFQSDRLKDLSSKATQADQKVKSLASLVRALDARLNSMTNLFVNSLLLYDLQCVYRLEKWKNENAENLKTWIDVISETDVLCSLGTFAFNHSHFCYPTVSTEQKIEADELGHPLLNSQECVTNTLTFGPEKNILVITGANMAGKSTFLRTLGVNVVLALAGAPVCAKAFSCPVIAIRSGMRTADSLQDHQSYFYAELNRLKTIMDELRSGTPLLILLDEILKGTNSTDKQAGSIALVKQLLLHRCLALIATHDLALGDLEHEHPTHVKNYCFEPTIENDQLSFDYKLKSGIAQKMNATFLMKKMGIIPA